MAGPKVIKRYANRKLYDTEKSCYVTLDEIARMIKEGVDVKVVDNQTKEDLTSITLAQILFEEEKKKKSVLPLHTLVGLVRSGQEAVTDFFEKTAARQRDFRSEAGRQVERIEQLLRQAGDSTEDGKRVLREALEGIRGSIDDTQRNVDERIKQVIASMVPLPHHQREIGRLKKRVAELEAKLEEVEKG